MTTDAEIRARHDAERKANLLAELDRNGWSLTATAQALGVAINYLQWMLKHYGLAKQYAKSGHPNAGRPWRKESGESR
jgi:hypothetical protein